MKPPFKYRVACRILELTRKLSFKAAWILSGILAFLFYRFNGKLQRTIRDNITQVFPEKTTREHNHMIKETFRHTIAFALEAGSVWMKPLQYGIDAIDSMQGLELLTQAQEEGKGILMLLPHLGNWEMANQFIAPRIHVVALYKPHPNKQLEHYIYNSRCRSGVTMVPTNTKGVAQILRHLKAGGMTVVLPDQVPDTTGGVVAPFFEKPALTPTLAPKLAKTSGATILGLVCARNLQGGFDMEITKGPSEIADPDLKVAATAMNTYLEKLIRKYPTQYQWSYKRFKNIPSSETQTNLVRYSEK